MVFAHPAETPRGDEVDRRVVFENVDLLIRAGGGEQGVVNSFAGDIAGMDDAALVMPAFTAEVKLVALLLFVVFADLAAGGEMRSELHQPLNLLRPGFHDSADVDRIAEVVARRECIGDMLIKGVALVQHARNAPLRETGVADFRLAFADNADAPVRFFRKHQSGGESGYASADNQMIVLNGFVFHCQTPRIRQS